MQFHTHTQKKKKSNFYPWKYLWDCIMFEIKRLFSPFHRLLSKLQNFGCDILGADNLEKVEQKNAQGS